MSSIMSGVQVESDPIQHGQENMSIQDLEASFMLREEQNLRTQPCMRTVGLSVGAHPFQQPLTRGGKRLEHTAGQAHYMAALPNDLIRKPYKLLIPAEQMQA